MVSFDENMSYLSTLMNLYERNEQFFYEQNSYIELTGKTLAPSYNVNLDMAVFAGLITQRITRTIVINITRCVSLVVVFDLIS